MSSDLQKKILETQRTSLYLWIGLLGSILLLAYVAFQGPSGTERPEDLGLAALSNPLYLIFALSGLFIGVVGRFLGFFLKGRSLAKFKLAISDGDKVKRLQEYFVSLIVPYALTDMTAVFGFMLVFAFGQRTLGFGLMFFGFLNLLLMKPKESDLSSKPEGILGQAGAISPS